MESYLIWVITAIIFLVIFIPYYKNFRRKQKEFLKRKQEAEIIGIGRPRSQFPMVDNAACIGCGSCVEACPEGDVLGVVFGKAIIINGDRCVGHGYCEQVCPVGALKVGLGDIKTREDIPVINDFNETNVEGLFIAGELGGISLIRNAITQGRMVMEKIASRVKDLDVRCDYDVIIVGGGPAGLSASLTAIEKDLSYLVLDQQEPGGTILQYPRKKLVMTQPVDIPLYGKLDKSEYSKEHLLDTWLSAIDQFGVIIKPLEKVDSVAKKEACFEVATQKGTYTSKFVVLAMGRRGTPRKLGVPGESQEKVMYQLVDAQSFSNNNILVVGGGDSAVEAAHGLALQAGNRVTLSYRRERLVRIKKKNQEAIDGLIGEGRVEALFSSRVERIEESSVHLLLEGGERRELENDFVFIFAGGIPPFELLKKAGALFGGPDGPEKRPA